MTAPREVLELAARGVRLLPVHSVDKGRCTCGDGDCQSPGKHPIQRGWQEIATTDPKALDEWWDRYPWANAGALMGGGQVALDVDPRHGGKQGLASLEAGLGGLPQTWTTLTGGSGGHLHFRVDGDVPTKNLAPGVELRGAGCFVVVPPSLHVSGREYAWDPARAPGVLALAWLPSQLLPEQDPVALPPIRKPLSPRMQRLLREGEIAKRMYQSRSEVIQAVMTNAAANGWSIDDVLDAMLDPTNAAGEKVRDMAAGRGGFPRARRYVEHCFRKAEAYLKANRREISVVDIDAALAAARAEVDFGGGPRGHSRVRVLRAHLQTAKKAGSVSYTASQRQLAEEAGSDPKTIRRVNGFLDEQGLVHRLSRGVGRVASTWELGVLLLPPVSHPPPLNLLGGNTYIRQILFTRWDRINGAEGRSVAPAG